MDSFGSIDRLAGSDLTEKGGLVFPKKSESGNSTPHESFKKPKSSLLGLDKLAAKKRVEAEESGASSSVPAFKQR